MGASGAWLRNAFRTGSGAERIGCFSGATENCHGTAVQPVRPRGRRGRAWVPQRYLRQLPLPAWRPACCTRFLSSCLIVRSARCRTQNAHLARQLIGCWRSSGTSVSRAHPGRMPARGASTLQSFAPINPSAHQRWKNICLICKFRTRASDRALPRSPAGQAAQISAAYF